MRILVTTPTMNGVGVDFITTIGHQLKEYGHDIDVLQFSGTSQSDQFNTTEVFVTRTLDTRLGWAVTTQGRWMFNWILYRRWRRAVRCRLADTEYDIVISDRICSAPGTLAAKDCGTPAVIITTGPAATRYDSTVTSKDKTPNFWDFTPSKKVQYPFIRSIHNWNHAAFTSAAAVIAVSEFDATITRETFNVDPAIVYLPVPLQEYVANNRTPTKVTMLNPRTENKGLDTFLEIAKRLPDVSFQIAGTLYDTAMESEIDQLPNVGFLGWCDDMRDVYSDTKLLLIPSKYEEGGPRIVAEAFANGIPVVGSDLGGTPEYVGKGGEIISAHDSVEAWTAAVERFIRDEEYYREKSRIAKQLSGQFDMEKRARDVEAILERATVDTA
jgi:glycosyltransferase involved in cell wall biosynthesis